MVVLICVIFLIAWLGEKDIWLRGKAIVHAQAVKHKIRVVLLMSLSSLIDLVLLH